MAARARWSPAQSHHWELRANCFKVIGEPMVVLVLWMTAVNVVVMRVVVVVVDVARDHGERDHGRDGERRARRPRPSHRRRLRD